MSIVCLQLKKLKILWLPRFIIILILVLPVAGSGCGTGEIGVALQLLEGDVIASRQADELGTKLSPELEAVSQTGPKQDEVTVIRIAAVGDIMAHLPQVNSAYNREEDRYDFKSHFAEVKPMFDTAHLVIGNLETILAGIEKGFSGYPRFNTPDELAEALAWAGFDVLSTANNHSLDRGEAGVLRTIEVLKQHGLLPVGTAAGQEDRKPIILERNNIKVGFLAYTYGTNGIPAPAGKGYLVNLIDEELIAGDLADLRLWADVVVVSIHWGEEYQLQPNARQQELAAKLVSWGADLVLGSHPHVLQAMEMLEVDDDRGKMRRGLVIYSLGNFISNQRDRYRDSGVILLVDLAKKPSGGAVEIINIQYVPTWVHKYYLQNRWQYRVLPVDEFVGRYHGGADEYLAKAEFERMVQVRQETTIQLEGK